ncbi:unnamed protein product [Orchesella dallaii]|uniref:Uncharacterized protein n=1 Tax=Orchesella dallaii TaxID=48710 RepID=A0ABP1RKG8_9HEXA
MASYLWSLLHTYWNWWRDAAENENDESGSETSEDGNPSNTGIVIPMVTLGVRNPKFIRNIDVNSTPFSVIEEISGADRLKTRKGIGLITCIDIEKDYGTINHLYQFDLKAFVAPGCNPLLTFNWDDKVVFEATQRCDRRGRDCWEVTFVKLHECCKPKQSNGQQTKCSSYLVKVKEVYTHFLEVEMKQKDTTLLIRIQRSIVRSLSNSDWIIGDWVRIGFSYIGQDIAFRCHDLYSAINAEETKIINFEIPELKYRKGKVTRRKMLLFIDDVIYFPNHIWKLDADEGMLVNCTYIASSGKDGIVSWNYRAISVEVIEKNLQKLLSRFATSEGRDASTNAIGRTTANSRMKNPVFMPSIHIQSAPFSVYENVFANGDKVIEGIGFIESITSPSYAKISGSCCRFDINKFVASASNPDELFKQGDKIKFEAKSHTRRKDWTVTFVQLYEPKFRQNGKQKKGCVVFRAQVKDVKDNYILVERKNSDRRTNLSITIPMGIVRRPRPFEHIDWMAGDWLLIGVNYDVTRGPYCSDREVVLKINETKAEIYHVDVEKKFTRVGKITRCVNTLLIDREIYLPRQVWQADANYMEGTVLNCTYIASSGTDMDMNTTWKYRAISVGDI